MLALTRKKGEALVIGNNVEITVLEVKGDQVKIGIQAPKDVSIYRKEIYIQIQKENEESMKNNRNTFDVNLSDDMLNTLQLPSGDEWSKLLDIERRIDDGQLEAIDELKNQIRLYGNLKERAEYILERTLKNR